jgi:HK97 family phage portal protein
VTLLSTGERDPGDWQKDAHFPPEQALAFFAVYACITQIAGDIAKLSLLLMERSADGIWIEGENPAYSPVLRKPNHFQTTQQFVESWMLSKGWRGNTYTLKERDERNVVIREYVLDTDRVTPLVAENGDVFYELRTDDLSHVPWATVVAPASEIIHDRMNCLFHPLVGVSPLYACGLAARQGLEIQKNSARFFENMSRPSGILVAPAKISDENAARLKREWEGNFGKGRIGKVAVLGDNMKYEPMAVTPVDSALVDQLKLSAEQVCAAFGVPRFMVGIGEMPGFENVQALTQWYYTSCLQKYIEAFERLQDDGLGLPHNKLRTEFNLDDLLRMDGKTQAEFEGVLVQRGISAPNEARRKFNKPPVTGGEKPYLQQQNFSLEALSKRDAQADPFKPASPPAPPPAEDPAEAGERAAAAVIAAFRPLLETMNSAQAEQQRQIAELQTQRDAERQAAAVIDAFERRVAQAVG